MLISELQNIDDLVDGETAAVDPGIAYGIREIDSKLVIGEVTSIIRRGDRLLACLADGTKHPVSGDHAWVLCPRHRV